MKITELETYVVGNPPPGFGGKYFVRGLMAQSGVQPRVAESRALYRRSEATFEPMIPDGFPAPSIAASPIPAPTAPPALTTSIPLPSLPAPSISPRS